MSRCAGMPSISHNERDWERLLKRPPPPQQKINHIAVDNPFAAQINQIAADHVFWIIIINFLRIAKFPVNTVFRQQICYLYIDPLTSFIADEINFLRIKFSHLYFLTAA